MPSHYRSEAHKKKLQAAARAGVKSTQPAWMKRAGRRQPTKSELATVESKRVDEEIAGKLAARKPKKPRQKPKTGFAGLNEALEGKRPPN